MITPYITGLAALCVPHPGRTKPFWHSLPKSDSTWTVAGRNSPETSWFFGDRELVNVAAYFAQADIKTDLALCASYERAVFELLLVNIEQKNQPVPNVQPSDIDDVVNFDQIREWVAELESAGQLIRGPIMQTWLTAGSCWEELHRED